MMHSAISLLNVKPLKFVDQFIYLSSNISSNESNVKIGKSNVDCYWQVIEYMEIWSLWYDKMRIFPNCCCVSTNKW